MPRAKKNVLSEKQDRNRQNQQAFRERVKSSASRVTLVVKKETHGKLREIARQSGISQGAVLDKLLGEGSIMNDVATPEKIIRETVDRIRREDFLQAESAQHCVGLMLSFNASDISDEENKSTPDEAKLNDLQKIREGLRREQNLIYRGNRKVQQSCIERYTPEIASRFNHNRSIQDDRPLQAASA